MTQRFKCQAYISKFCGGRKCDVMIIEDLWLESTEVQDESKVKEHAFVSARNNFGLVCCRWFHYGLGYMNFSSAIK
jgi:hypothetical protein